MAAVPEREVSRFGRSGRAPKPADARASNEGLTKRVILKVLEAFFRRPIVNLLPLLLLIVLGTLAGFSSTKQYRSTATLNATSGTLLADLTQSGSRSVGFETPAVTTSRNLNQLIRSSPSFLAEVVEYAGLRTAVTNGQVTADEIRASISAVAEGDNLISVSATTPRAEQSQRLAEAAANRFIEYVISNDIIDLTVRRQTYEQQLESYGERLQAANSAYQEYMLGHQIADEDDRPFVERLEIQRLEQEMERATASYQDAQGKVDEATLASDVARTVVSRQLRVVDEAELPVAPQPRLQKAVLTVALFTMLGLVLSLVLIVLTALLDRTVRVPGDISAKFGMDVIAVVPTARR